jgi:ubiquinone/menaquinone biosynthesis C-methylase UbiE
MVPDVVMDPLLAMLIADGTLRCAHCGGRLEQRLRTLQCSECSAVFPLKSGVADLVTTYGKPGRRAAVPSSFVTSVMSALHLPDDDDTRASVLQAIDDTMLVTGDGALTAEIAELADRIGIGDFQRPARDDEKSPARPKRWFNLGRNRSHAIDPRAGHLVLVRHYLGLALAPDSLLMRSFRIRNQSPVAWTAQREPTFALLAEWLDSSGRPQPGLTTVNPIETTIPSHGETTSILKLRTPASPGAYSLQVTLSANGRRFGEAASFAVPMVVGVETPLPPEIARTANVYSYIDDHDQANRMLWRHLEDVGAGRRLRLVEIGGGIHPQAVNMTHLGHAIIAADISVAMGQLGRLCNRKFATNPLEHGLLAFVACDAARPPFAANTVDGVVMYAAFHHFADPVALLDESRRILAPDGFVALMCEPCAPDPVEPTYLRDLRKGINEQNFALEEYIEMFSRSGMRVLTGQVDGGSLKVILAAA